MINTTGSRLSPEERRAQIIAVAAQHFARDGVVGTSMSAVAKEAGVARTLIYHYFPGKEELLGAVLAAEAAGLLAETAPDASLTPQENVEKALRAYIKHFRTSTSSLSELYSSSDATEVGALVERSHAMHIERILALTGAEDTPAMHRNLRAWLIFIAALAQDTVDVGTQEQDDVAVLSLDVLATIVGHPF